LEFGEPGIGWVLGGQSYANSMGLSNYRCDDVVDTIRQLVLVGGQEA